jgi:hypothetical protein
MLTKFWVETSRGETMSEVMRKSEDDIKINFYRYMSFTVFLAVKSNIVVF